MLPMLCCIKCKHWRLIEEDTAYCSVCRDPLQTDDFDELLGLNQEAVRECPVALDRWQGEVGCALGFMLFVAAFTESWVPPWIEQTLVEGMALLSAVGIAIRHHHTKTLLRQKYARLWEIPTIFRPSITKP